MRSFRLLPYRRLCYIDARGCNSQLNPAIFFSFISPSTVAPFSPIQFTCFPTLTQTSRIPTTFHSVTFFLRILHSFTLCKLLGKLLFLNLVQKPEVFRKLFAFFISFIEKKYDLRCTNKYAYITFDDVFSVLFIFL